MAWSTLPLAVFLIFQVQGALSGLLGMTKEDVTLLKEIKAKVMELPTHEADLYEAPTLLYGNKIWMDSGYLIHKLEATDMKLARMIAGTSTWEQWQEGNRNEEIKAKFKDYMNPEFKAKLPTDDPKKAANSVFEASFQFIDYLEDDDKLRMTLNQWKTNPIIATGKDIEFEAALVNVLKKSLPDKFTAEAEKVVGKLLKEVCNHVKAST